jgi:hypothetical protein
MRAWFAPKMLYVNLPTSLRFLRLLLRGIGPKDQFSRFGPSSRSHVTHACARRTRARARARRTPGPLARETA